MIEFAQQNRDVLVVFVSLVGILLSLAFGGVLSWRHKIVLDYESRGDVAINILRDRFVQRACTHYSEVADERKRQKTAVEEIYKRPEQTQLIRELGEDLELQNRVRRLFKWLVKASNAAFTLLWGAIVTIVLGVGLLWLEVSLSAWVIWSIFLIGTIVGFAGSVSLMCALDGRYFHLVHEIINPEGE